MFTIEIVEKEDATGFKLYDLTNWPFGYNPVFATAVALTVEYLGVTYTYTTVPGLLADMGCNAVGNLNLCGNALNFIFCSYSRSFIEWTYST